MFFSLCLELTSVVPRETDQDGVEVVGPAKLNHLRLASPKSSNLVSTTAVANNASTKNELSQLS